MSKPKWLCKLKLDLKIFTVITLAVVYVYDIIAETVGLPDVPFEKIMPSAVGLFSLITGL